MKIKILLITFILILLVTFKYQGNKKENNFKITSGTIDLNKDFYLKSNLHWNDGDVVKKEIMKITSISLNKRIPKTIKNSKELFDFMMINGNLPDVMVGKDKRNEFIKYGLEGTFIPLNDLIEEHAPDIVDFFEDNPHIKEEITAPDGNIYFLPSLQEERISRGYWIRKDWLEKLDLEAPTTIDELYNVMVAFRDRDPNGSGKNDTIPIFFRQYHEMLRMTTLWGARTSGTDTFFSFYKNDDGKIVQGGTEKEFKEGLKHIIKWYSEGLIDSEVFTRGKSSREDLFGRNRGGITRDFIESTALLNSFFEDKIEGFNLQPMLPPININNEIFEEDQRSLLKSNGWGITNHNKQPIETIKLFNYFFTEKDKGKTSLKVKDIYYEIIDGEPVFKNQNSSLGDTRKKELKDSEVKSRLKNHQNLDGEKKYSNKIGEKGLEMYKENVNYPLEFSLPLLTPQELLIYESKWPIIRNFMEETIQSWILLNVDIEEEWDEYIEFLDKIGLCELIKILQAAEEREKNQIEFLRVS